MAGTACFDIELNLDRDLPSLSRLPGPELPSFLSPTLTLDNHVNASIRATLFPPAFPRLIVSPLSLVAWLVGILIGLVVIPVEGVCQNRAYLYSKEYPRKGFSIPKSLCFENLFLGEV